MFEFLKKIWYVWFIAFLVAFILLVKPNTYEGVQNLKEMRAFKIAQNISFAVEKGLIVSFQSETNTAYVDDLLWSTFTYDQKKALATAWMDYCTLRGFDRNKILVKDSETGTIISSIMEIEHVIRYNFNSPADKVYLENFKARWHADSLDAQIINLIEKNNLISKNIESYKEAIQQLQEENAALKDNTIDNKTFPYQDEIKK